jgi:uncharacterized protein (TIGR02599 family)
MDFPPTARNTSRPAQRRIKGTHCEGGITFALLKFRPGKANPCGFTLLEMMVSFVVLAILVILIATMIDATAKATRRPIEQAQTFQEARTAFELLTRRLSQATLNTYWDYDDPNNPTEYLRQSELHFVIGRTATELGTNALDTPTFAVFFQAPLGKGNDSSLRSLSSLLNNCGFFIRFGSDASAIPPVFPASSAPAEKFRFRLYQWIEPSNELQTVQQVTGTAADKNWFRTPLASTPDGLRPIAENIVALILHPRLSSQDNPQGDALTTDFTYDSRLGPSSRLTFNQLPPSVDVIMVAIDETSAARLAAANGSSPPDLGLATLFNSVNPNTFTANLKTLEDNLQELNLNYRLFRTTVKIPAAKWSGY